MLVRRTIIERAYHDCMKEMYARAQPSCDYDQLLKDAEEGKIGKDERVYERYYLSQEEFEYIRKKYIDAYGLEATWKPNIEILERYLKEGGSKNKWIPDRVDEDGFRHPGHRGYEKVLPIQEQIDNIIKEHFGEIESAELANKLTKMVFDTITDCKEFYRFDREESDFSCAVALGASPTSNPKTVIEYWKSQGVDIEIEERNPLLFYDMDYYGDEFEEIMEEDYGENWKEHWDNEWKAEILAKEEELKRKWNGLQKINS